MAKIRKLMFLATLGVFALTSCGSGGGSSASSSSSGGESSESSSSSSSSDPFDPSKKVASDSLYVKKVENLNPDFYCGMDLSSLLSLEAGGTKFYNFQGQEEDILKVVADNGVNLVRVRVWNNPYDAEGNGYGGGNCTINTALEIGKRATRYGVGLLVDFHYSDFWADPSRQTAPKAWKNMSVDAKANALYTYTLESLNTLKDNNVDVKMVQVGNETNNFMLAGERGITNFAKLVNKGYDAVKAVYPKAEVAVHFTNPEKRGYLQIAEQMEEAGVKYDVFGSSYYPFFHGTLANLKTQLSKPIEFGKKVMVMETQYAFTDEDTDECGNQFDSKGNYPRNYPVTIAGQSNCYRDVCDVVASLKNNAGIGVCWWEGAWITASPQRSGESDGDHWTRLEQMWSRYGSGWASKYAYEYDTHAPQPSEWGHFSAGTVVDNQAFFDKNGKPNESLKVFNLIKYGNDAPEYLDGVADKDVEFMVNEEIVLPTQIDGIYNTDERKPVDVTWEQVDFDDLKRQGPGTYDINGTVTVGQNTYHPVCHLTLKVANYVLNGSFEDGAVHWTLENKLTDPFTAGTYYAMITNQNSNNPITGDWSVHAYSASKHIKFTVEQQVAAFDAQKTLKLRYAVTGGVKDGIEVTEANCKQYVDFYAYLLEDDVQVQKIDGYITKWGNKYSFEATDIVVKPGKTYKVGISCEANMTGNAPDFWIDFDDVNFYE